jgi:hypothetical protein
MIVKVKVLNSHRFICASSFTVKIEDLVELDEQDPEVVPGLYQGGA